MGDLEPPRGSDYLEHQDPMSAQGIFRPACVQEEDKVGAICAICLLGEEVPQRIIRDSHHDDVRDVFHEECLGLVAI